MGAIDIGSGAVTGSYSTTAGNTNLDATNPANDTGAITSFEFYFSAAGSGVKVGVFYYVSEYHYASRDYETIGNVSSGSKQTFSGLNCDVSSGDIIGSYNSGGTLYRNLTGGGGHWTYSGDAFGAGSIEFSPQGSTRRVSLYGTGASPGWSNITKINGIAATSISKVNGIAVASISKVNGTAV